MYMCVERYETDGVITGYLIMDEYESTRRFSSHELRDLIRNKPNAVSNLMLTRDGKLRVQRNNNIRTITEDRVRSKASILRICFNNAKLADGEIKGIVNLFIRNAYNQGFTFREMYDYVIKTANNILSAGQVDCKRYANISNYLSMELGVDYKISILGMAVIVVFYWDTSEVMSGEIGWIEPSYRYREAIDIVSSLVLDT